LLHYRADQVIDIYLRRTASPAYLTLVQKRERSSVSLPDTSQRARCCLTEDFSARRPAQLNHARAHRTRSTMD